jgi:hypothetical protein
MFGCTLKGSGGTSEAQRPSVTEAVVHLGIDEQFG